MKTVGVLLALLMICVASKLGPSKELKAGTADSTKEVKKMFRQKGKIEDVQDKEHLFGTFRDSADPFPPPPPPAKTARYIVHNTLWGTVSTTSVSPPLTGTAFGNVQSFSDGTVDNSTGVPYFFLAKLDPVVQNTESNQWTSLSLSEAQLDSKYCKITSQTDPELPLCARVTLTGKLVNVGAAELKFAQDALFERHPAMKGWQNKSFHDWQTMRLDITNVWLLDTFGPAVTVPLEEYFNPEL